MNSDPVILYVEDDPRSQKVLELTFKVKMRLTHVNIFGDSSNFLQRVRALYPQPDVIFLDIHIEPLNGFEMLKMLRNIDRLRNIPIVALTASVMNEEVAMMRAAGFDGCLAKPVDLDTFELNFKSILRGEQVWNII
jgi:two-component system, cell cycle response regulator DivK